MGAPEPDVVELGEQKVASSGFNSHSAALVMATILLSVCAGGLATGYSYREYISAVIQDRPLIIESSEQNGVSVLTLTNPTLYDVEIVGFNASCGCISSSDIPLVVPQFESQELVFSSLLESGDSVEFFLNQSGENLVWFSP